MVGLELWSLMGSGSWGGPTQDGSVPTHLDAWSKQKLGYLTPTVLSAGETGHTLTPNPPA